MDQEQRIKIKNYETLNKTVIKKGILFTGSSLMEQFPVCEMCRSAGIKAPVYNRGVGGFTTDDFLEHIDTQLLALEPSVVFLNIGTNDMHPRFGAAWEQHLLSNYRKILSICRERLPETEVILMAYYPINDQISFLPEWAKEACRVRTLTNIDRVNGKVQEMALEMGCLYLDANDDLKDDRGYLKEEYTLDGIHMYAAAYEKVFQRLIKRCILVDQVK